MKSNISTQTKPLSWTILYSINKTNFLGPFMTLCSWNNGWYNKRSFTVTTKWISSESIWQGKNIRRCMIWWATHPWRLVYGCRYKKQNRGCWKMREKETEEISKALTQHINLVTTHLETKYQGERIEPDHLKITVIILSYHAT